MDYDLDTSSGMVLSWGEENIVKYTVVSVFLWMFPHNLMLTPQSSNSFPSTHGNTDKGKMQMNPWMQIALDQERI